MMNKILRYKLESALKVATFFSISRYFSVFIIRRQKLSDGAVMKLCCQKLLTIKTYL